MAEGSKLTPVGKLAVGVFVAACAFGAYYFFVHGRAGNAGQDTQLLRTARPPRRRSTPARRWRSASPTAPRRRTG